jgi:hypothetical protein
MHISVHHSITPVSGLAQFAFAVYLGTGSPRISERACFCSRASHAAIVRPQFGSFCFSFLGWRCLLILFSSVAGHRANPNFGLARVLALGV